MEVNEAWVDGNIVVLLTQFEWTRPWSMEPGGTPVMHGRGIDVFRLENGNIVEHWDVAQNNRSEP